MLCVQLAIAIPFQKMPTAVRAFFKMKGLFKKLTQVSTVNAEMEM